MVHIPSTYTYNYWAKTPTEVVELTCLMPNGVLIPLETNRNATLAEIKEDLWDEASKYPLHGTLRDANSYVFSCINSMAEAEELRDENRRLCDIRPFCSVLKVIEKEGEKGDKILDSSISHLIGKGLHEFVALKNSEVNDFRWKMRLLGDELAQSRQKKSWEEKVCYQFPPRLTPPGFVPKNIESRLKDGNIVLVTKFENTEVRSRRLFHPRMPGGAPAETLSINLSLMHQLCCHMRLASDVWTTFRYPHQELATHRTVMGPTKSLEGLVVQIQALGEERYRGLGSGPPDLLMTLSDPLLSCA